MPAEFIDTVTVGPWAKLATLRLLRSIFDMAREDGRIHINPAQGVSAGRIPARERHRYLTASEVAALAAACGDHGDVLTILAFTGLRWPELVGLRVGDIDLTRRLYVRQPAPEVEGRTIVGPPKTRAAVRTVPLPQIVIDALKPRIDNRAPDEQAITSPNGGSDQTTGTGTGTGAKPSRKPIWPHSQFMTCATPTPASPGPPALTVTANIYSDFYSDELDHVATNLDRLHDIAKSKANGQEPDKTNHQ